MTNLERTAAEFLSHRRIAVAGVARGGDTAANIIYRRLRRDGYDVFAVNPNADEVEGNLCYASIAELPPEVAGVVVATHPNVAASVAKDCIRAGIPRVWLHRAFGQGSYSEEAEQLCRSAGITVIPGACPMMFLQPVDFGHRCIRAVLGIAGKLPRVTEEAPAPAPRLA